MVNGTFQRRVSIDLRKAFDRVEHGSLFNALTHRGDEPGYIHPFQLLYSRQVGILGDGTSFEIRRGVRQGDVLSPMLFNAVFEPQLLSGSCSCQRMASP